MGSPRGSMIDFYWPVETIKPKRESRRARAASEEPTIEGAFAADGVDLTVIRWMVERTPTERLAAAQDLIDATWLLRAPDEA